MTLIDMPAPPQPFKPRSVLAELARYKFYLLREQEKEEQKKRRLLLAQRRLLEHVFSFPR
jgi:hypothetical protein